IAVALTTAGAMFGLLHLFGDETANRVAPFESVEKNPVGPLVELFLFFTLNVGLSSKPQLTSQRCTREFVGNSLTDYLDAFENQCKIAGRHFALPADQYVAQQGHVLLSHRSLP